VNNEYGHENVGGGGDLIDESGGDYFRNDNENNVKIDTNTSLNDNDSSARDSNSQSDISNENLKENFSDNFEAKLNDSSVDSDNSKDHHNDKDDFDMNINAPDILIVNKLYRLRNHWRLSSSAIKSLSKAPAAFADHLSFIGI
jgi:hypothetical protein